MTSRFDFEKATQQKQYKNMSKIKSNKKKLSAEQNKQLIKVLKIRFEVPIL